MNRRLGPNREHLLIAYKKILIELAKLHFPQISAADFDCQQKALFKLHFLLQHCLLFFLFFFFSNLGKAELKQERRKKKWSYFGK